MFAVVSYACRSGLDAVDAFVVNWQRIGGIKKHHGNILIDFLLHDVVQLFALIFIEGFARLDQCMVHFRIAVGEKVELALACLRRMPDTVLIRLGR